MIINYLLTIITLIIDWLLNILEIYSFYFSYL